MNAKLRQKNFGNKNFFNDDKSVIAPKSEWDSDFNL